MRALVVEDDPAMAQLEEIYLQRAGFEVRAVPTGTAGLEEAADFLPDVIILDLNLPDISGLDVLTSLATTSDAFVLIVSASSEESDMLRGLGMGADDYLTKPIRPAVMIARIESYLRRRSRWHGGAEDDALHIGNATLDRDHSALRTKDATVDLTNMEFRLLAYLGSAQGRLRTRKQIIEDVWNDFSGIQTRVIDVHIAAIRKKLAQVNAGIAIASVRGIGYRLDAGAPAHLAIASAS
jgi:DNA-binding response OmpR family regulator